MVYLVELHRDDTTNDPEICTPCFAAISKYLEGNSSKNKEYVTPMADILFSGTVRGISTLIVAIAPSLLCFKVWNTELNDNQNVESMLMNMVKNSP